MVYHGRDQYPHFKQGYKRLEEELARLKSERPAIIQAIKEAREEGRPA